MALWTVCYDATVLVGLEADGEDDAVQAAERMMGSREDAECPVRNGVVCTVGEVFLIRNEDTGEEVQK